MANITIMTGLLCSFQAGMTALMMVAENDYQRFVDKLLQGGADTKIQDVHCVKQLLYPPSV